MADFTKIQSSSDLSYGLSLGEVVLCVNFTHLFLVLEYILLGVLVQLGPLGVLLHAKC